MNTIAHKRKTKHITTVTGAVAYRYREYFIPLCRGVDENVVRSIDSKACYDVRRRTSALPTATGPLMQDRPHTRPTQQALGFLQRLMGCRPNLREGTAYA